MTKKGITQAHFLWMRPSAVMALLQPGIEQIGSRVLRSSSDGCGQEAVSSIRESSLEVS